MKRTIAHIINPFNAAPTSDLHTAQPITFASMRHAQTLAADKVTVELLSAQFPEDRNMVPEGFHRTRDLDRSVLDMGAFDRPLKLPILADILQRLYDESDAEYLIYTNVDIGVYPDFYSRVNQFIEEGHDAFIINRRRISEKYVELGQLQEIYNDRGKKHPGFDCFVFHRDLFPLMELKAVCIGVPFIGITLSQNVFALAQNFKLYTDEVLTFHIGMEIIKGRAPREFFHYNQREFWAAMNSSLRPHMHLKKLPYSHWPLPARIVRWGLQPSFPIRLMLRLEKDRVLGYFRGTK